MTLKQLTAVTFFFPLMIVLSCLSGVQASESLKLLPVKYLSLEESFRLARENSITLKMKDSRLLAAKLNTQNVELDWIPDLLVGAGYQYQENNQDRELGKLFPFISLSQIVLNDHASYKTKLDAMNRLMGAKVQREANLRELYTDIIKKYFALLDAQNQLQLEEQLLKQRLIDFNKTEKRSQEGMVSNFELMQNEAMVGLAEIEQEISRNRVEHLEFELIALLNPKTEIRVIASDKFTPSFYTISFDECKESAQKHHITLRLNDQILKELPEFRKLVRRVSWPSVSLSAYLGSGATQWDNEDRYGLFITATKPLYDFGKTKRKQQILDIELLTIEKSIMDFKRNFLLGLKFLHKKFINAGNMVQNLDKQNDLNDKLMKAVQKSYDMGIISFEELQKRMHRENERKKDYRDAVSRYLVAEMLLKLNSGVSDIDVLLKQGPEWIKLGFNGTATTIEDVIREQH